VQAKFGVLPASIPDYLALVGDSADGYPGISGFGAKSAAAILRRFGRIEDIPGDPTEWRAGLLKGGTLARRLSEQRDLALLFKKLATLRVDAPLFDSVDQLRWQGPTPSFAKFAESIEAPELVRRAELAAARHF
jgi:5'-3' exonuclease